MLHRYFKWLTILNQLGNNLKQKVLRNCATEVKLNLPKWETYNLDRSIIPTSSTLTRDEALALYTVMVEMRQMETTAANLYRKKLLRGFLHLYSGQEAVAAGVFSMMQAVDDIVTTYRCHVWAMLTNEGRGETVLAELLGRVKGVSIGRGGSMHLFTKRLFGGQAIVGAQVPVGTGMALAHKYKGTGGVAIICLGDGAINQGQCGESFNMACLYSLPALFLVEDNRYGMGTSVKRASACSVYMRRAHPAPGITCNGMDVIAMREVARMALQYCRSGKGPLLIHAHTYRYLGHSMSDPGTSYRTRAEVDEMRKNHDPITGFKKIILDTKLATADELKNIDVKIKKNMQASLKAALASPEPAESELTKFVYKQVMEIPRTAFVMPKS